MNSFTGIEKVQMMRRAKERLAGNWGSAVVATLVYLVISAVAGSVYVGELLLYGPLCLGYILYITALFDTRTDNLNLLFSGFNRFVQTMVAGLLYAIAVSIGMALLIVPGIILMCGFSMTFFIMAEDPNISGVDALKASWNMARGYKWDIFCFGLRFLGWFLLCLLTCGIGLLWLYPYITASMLCYYRRLRYGAF